MMEPMPIISVVIPAYNAEKTIGETLKSIQQQTFQDLEIIVINDGSTDNTQSLVAAIPDPRIKLFSYANGGLAVARNRGISHATGEFVAFIDADDLWTPDKLASQLAALQQNPEAGAAYSWTAFIDDQGQFLYAQKPIFFEGNVYGEMLVKNFVANGSNLLIRKSALAAAGLFDPSLKSAEDWNFYIRLAACSPWAVVPQYQILYRKSANSMSSKVPIMEAAILAVIDQAFQQAPASLQSLKARSLANAYQFLAKLYLEHTTESEGVRLAVQKLKSAVWASPRILRAKETQRLALKLLLLRSLPSSIASRVIQLFAQQSPLVPREGLPLPGLNVQAEI